MLGRVSYLVDLTNRIGALDRPVDLLLAELAEAQHGVVAIWQLYLLGFSWREVQRRAGSGRLHRIYRGVYAVGHARLTERGRWMAAVLRFGREALLSHRSGAGLRSLLADGRAVIDVTVPGRSRAGIAGITLHQPRSLHPADVDVYDGIPTTSVARLLLDIAATEPRRRLERVFEAAERERVLDMRAVHAVIERAAGHRGRQPLLALLAAVSEPAHHTRSRLERRLLKRCRAVGLPEPAVNVWIEGQEVDLLWAEAKVIVELDSWEFHRTRHAFERDRARDVKLQLAGYRVLRFTWRQLETEPQVVVEAIEAALRASLAVR
jgi:very-short-patch-repair endonuclease